MELPNPNVNQPFDRVANDKEGNPEYGFRRTPDNVEEIVHIPSGRSNNKYWKPEMVMNPENCQHTFKIESMGTREIVCTNPTCGLGFTFHVKDIIEHDKKVFILFKGIEYQLS